MTPQKTKRTEYWAGVPREKIGQEIMAKVMAQKEYLEKSGTIKILRKAYKEFYGTPYIEQVDTGVVAAQINHFASTVRHIHVMVTSQRPAWEPRAVNTDSESQAATSLASGLLDYYMREKGLESKLIEACERALFLKEGWITCSWDVQGGEIYGQDPDTGFPVREGDIVYKVKGLTDITRDIHKRDNEHNWFIVRDRENKYDLAARFAQGNQELFNKITALSDDAKVDEQYEIRTNVDAIQDDNDEIPVYRLEHAKTPAMPQGRLTIALSNDIVLFDGPLPTKRPYIFPITSSKQYETGFGHSNSQDLLPLADAFNTTFSTILSNISAHGIQNLQAPKGAAPNVTQLEGMNLIEYDPKAGKLEALQLLQTAPEVYNFLEVLLKNFSQLSSISDINKGNAPATMSGTAMALLTQQTLQFYSGTQLSYALLSEAVGTATVELLQTFAVVPRIAMIAGKSKRPMMKKFKGSDLNGVSRMIVDTANPLSKNHAGKVEIAKDLLQAGMIKNPQKYIEVLTTGNLEPMFEHEFGQNLSIRSENEKLMNGEQVPVLMTDDDALHVLEHACLANSPEARENPKLTGVLTEHMMMHVQQATTKNPILAAMLKQQSFAPPPMPPPGPGAPMSDNSGAPPPMNNENPVTTEAQAVPLPQPAQPPQI